jgi:hypothetical protein
MTWHASVTRQPAPVLAYTPYASVQYERDNRLYYHHASDFEKRRPDDRNLRLIQLVKFGSDFLVKESVSHNVRNTIILTVVI